MMNEYFEGDEDTQSVCQVSDDEILAANETYGSLGELAIMALPKSQVTAKDREAGRSPPQILALFKKLELGDITRELSSSEVMTRLVPILLQRPPQDFMASIKDANVKEIIAKESLEYQPSKSSSDTMQAQRAAVGQLVELGHSVFHKFGRLQVTAL